MLSFLCNQVQTSKYWYGTGYRVIGLVIFIVKDFGGIIMLEIQHTGMSLEGVSHT